MSTVLARTVSRILFFPLLVTAVGLVVRGGATVGGGFSGGLIAAFAFLLEQLTFPGTSEPHRISPRTSWWTGIAGAAVVLIVAFGPMVAGYPPVTQFPRPGSHVVQAGALELSTSLVFEAGLALLTFGLVTAVIGQLEILHLESRE